MENELKIIDERIVLGKEFKIYGTVEEPLFLAKDVAEWIDYSMSNGKYKVSQMVSTVDDDEKLVSTIKTPDMKQAREMVFLTEDGLYEVLMQSRKPIAKEFKKKVKEILKQLRQTGGVVVEGREEEFIDNYFPSFSDDVKKAMTLDLYHKNQEYKKQLEAQKSKVDYYDNVLQCDNLLTTTQVAKDLGMSAIKLNNILVEHKVIYKEGKCYLPYAKYHFLITEGYADYKITEHGQHLYWTEKGRKWIIELINEIEEWM